jgi:hypothetical protein
MSDLIIMYYFMFTSIKTAKMFRASPQPLSTSGTGTRTVTPTSAN